MKTLLLITATALVFTSPAFAENDFKAGDFIIRARALGVVPDESGHVSNGDSISINDSVVPELDFTYFFTPNISAELIAAVTPHDVKTSSGIDAGSSWLLPPTLTLQYHFTQFNAVKPYVGAGVNYTHFFNADAGALNAVKYEDSFGGALQVGMDIPIKDNWYFNVDVKKVFISTTAKFSPSGVRADADIDPLLIGVGVGYKF
jgi:outer membrane protein